MGELIILHNGQPVYNFEAYFVEDGTYIEEYDTADGRHWIGGVRPEDYPDDMREEAIELGIIDQNGTVLPMK